ncbi:hypothetical protein H0W91_02465 [Patescibacteria group bacterium]|nr:hypothetical protein [Patescibacteria group bacterium]
MLLIYLGALIMTEKNHVTLRQELEKIAKIEELDAHLMEARYAGMDDVTFEIYVLAYDSRGWRMPQEIKKR